MPKGDGYPQTLCWRCTKAIGTCSWSEEFIPVNGWDATPVKIKSTPPMGCDVKYIDSFYVKSCPEFIPDPPRKSRPF